MFVDSSAVLAILLREPEAAAFIAKMKTARALYFSAVVRFESIMRLANMKSGPGHPIAQDDFKAAEIIIDRFFARYNMSLLPIGEKESKLATDGYLIYGKGTGSRAQLNMGDCFSWACAKSADVPLLFKGNDFIHTDLGTVKTPHA